MDCRKAELDLHMFLMDIRDSLSLTDSQLLSQRLLFTAHDQLPAICPDKPDQDLSPIVIGKIELPKSEDQLRCRHCKTPFREGFLVTNSTGLNYVIGSNCGPKYYNSDEFRLSKGRLTAEIDRQKALRSLQAIVAAAGPVEAWIATATQSDAYQGFLKNRRELVRLGGDPILRLKQITKSGAPLTELVKLKKRADTSKKKASNSSKPDWHNAPIGQLRGGAMVDDTTELGLAGRACREAFKLARAALEAPSGTLSPSEMSKVIRAAQTAYDRLKEVAEQIGSAHHFFTHQNLSRVERWSRQFQFFSIGLTENGFLIRTDSRSHSFDAIEKCVLPKVPTFRLE